MAKVVHLDENKNVVVFLVETPTTIMALGGSSTHLIGNVPGKDVNTGYSFTTRLLGEFEALVERKPLFLVLPNYRIDILLNGGVSLHNTPWTNIIEETARLVRAPSQRISFLAKRLLANEHNGKNIVLATPLHVALVE